MLYGFSLRCSNWAMDLATELVGSALTASRSAVRCSMQLVLPNRNSQSRSAAHFEMIMIDPDFPVKQEQGCIGCVENGRSSATS